MNTKNHADVLRAEIMNELEDLSDNELATCVALISSYKHEPSQVSALNHSLGDPLAPCVPRT